MILWNTGLTLTILSPPTTLSEKEALAFKQALIDQVKSKELIVVCDGIDKSILPNLSSTAPKVNFAPVGPHPCGSFEVRMKYW